MKQSIDFGMVQVEHATVGISNEQLSAGLRDDDGGAVLGRGVYPELLASSLIFNLLQTVIKVGVFFLGLNPSFQSAGQSAFYVFVRVGSAIGLVGRIGGSGPFKTCWRRARAQTSSKNLHRATARYVPNHPNHLRIQDGDFSSFVQSQGELIMGAARIKVGLANLGQKIHWYQEGERDVRQQI
jgi:hypothetical protein